jgi:DNA-binding Lrp family transcriptional regulator
VFLAIPLNGMAQQYYNNVSVVRAVKLRILPGKAKEFYEAFAYAPKVFEAEKAAGIITGYEIFTSVNFEGPEKWDVMYVIHFKNMGVLDTSGEIAEPIVAKVYGSPEKRAEILRMRVESTEVVSSELIREIHLK